VVVPELAVAVAALHPYDVPEIIAVNVAAGCKEYLQWVEKMTTKSSDGKN
jgi:periplasmic divalent cation tolerance protein